MATKNKRAYYVTNLTLKNITLTIWAACSSVSSSTNSTPLCAAAEYDKGLETYMMKEELLTANSIILAQT